MKKGPRVGADPFTSSVRRNRRNAGGSELQNPNTKVVTGQGPDRQPQMGSVRRNGLVALVSMGLRKVQAIDAPNRA